MVRENVNVALIGAGRIGKLHGDTLAFRCRNARLACICDIDGSAASSLASQLGCDTWTTSSDDIWSDASIDAVLIASSTDSHTELIENAASVGKPVFCEKPIALDLPSTDSAIDAAERAGIPLQIGFQRRYDSAYARTKSMIDSGELGTIEMIRDTMRDPEPPPEDYIATCGGLFRDMAIHDFDCVRWLVDEEPVEIFAYGSNLVDPVFGTYNDIDTSIVMLKFESGAIASIENSRRSGFGYDVRTEVFGSEGGSLIGYSRDTPMLHFTQDGVKSDHIHWFIERFREAYVAEIKDFIDAIRNDRPTAVTGQDGRAALAMAYAAEASIAEHAPIPVSRFQRSD